MHVTFGSLGSELIGVEYLSAYLKEYGHRTSLAHNPALFNDRFQLNMPLLAKLFDQDDRIVEYILHLDPDLIDIVRHRQPLKGIDEKDAALIAFGRELFGDHNVSAETYARVARAFGERDLVDIVGLMGAHAADAAVLAAFDQHLPEGLQPLLPLP